MEQGGHDPGAARADRVAEGDRAAVHVDLRPVEAELAAVGQGLSGERLVDLDQVERLDRQLDPLEQPADAGDRGEEQPFRGDLGLAVADDPGERLQAEPLDGALAGDDRRRGAVGDPGGIAGGDRALRRRAAVLAVGQGEGRLEPGERLERRVAARAFVGRHDRLAALGVADRHRRHLGLEAAGVDRRDRLLVAEQGERILVGAR